MNSTWEQDFQRLKENVISYHYDRTGSPEKILSVWQPDGSFSDLDYTDRSWTAWQPAKHLARIVSLCKIYVCPDNPHYKDAALQSAILQSLRYYTGGTFASDNWWWKDVGVPTFCRTILLLMRSELPEDTLQGILSLYTGIDVRSTTFSYYSNVSIDGLRPYAGCGGSVFRRLAFTHVDIVGSGCSAAAGMQHVYECIRALEHELSTITWAAGHSPNGLYTQEHNLKTDYSYHEHENCFLPNSYGTLLTANLALLFRFWEGTNIHIRQDAAEMLSRILLEGYRYARYRGYTPTMVIGRNVGAANGTLCSGSMGKDMAVICRYLLSRNVSVKEELAEFLECLENPTEAPHFTGTKFFWHSDYLSHNRETYAFMMQGVSNRVKRQESCLSKNIRGMFISDGSYNLLRTGTEYEKLQPCMDWRRLAGTTVNVNVTDAQLNPECEIDTKIDTKRIFGGAKGTTEFAGGVSDGLYGMFALDYDHLGVQAKKAWFCFDDAIVCLGAGITAQPGAEAFTTLNQCALRGEVLADDELLSSGAHTLDNCRWVLHDGVGYVFPEGDTQVTLENTLRTGAWSLVDREQGSDEPVTQPVFLLGLSHREAQAQYCYILLPNADRDTVSSFAAQPSVTVVANSTVCQAVWQEETGQLQAVFYAPGSVCAGDFTLQVDSACALMLKREGEAYRLWVSDPAHGEKTVRISLTGSLLDTVSISLEKGFRYNNLGRPYCYDSRQGLLPMRGAMDDELL